MKFFSLKTFLCFVFLFFSNLYHPFLYANSSIENSMKIILPKPWEPLQPILNQRLHQKKTKMKLTVEQAKNLEKFLSGLTNDPPHLLKLKLVLPKTTLELLRSVSERNVALEEADKIAAYLINFVKSQNFQNVNAFDENTSHIIGREWSEIDYTGEGMTWEGQKKKYQPYGITHFKSEDNIIKFFKVESTLPYFNKIYHPQR